MKDKNIVSFSSEELQNRKSQTVMERILTESLGFERSVLTKAGRFEHIGH